MECDGDRYHPLEKLAGDIKRQSILERLGWQFVRIRGSAFYRNAESAMQPLFERLRELEIPQEADSGAPSAKDMSLILEVDELIERKLALRKLADGQAEADDALVNRQRAQEGAARVNPKRAYRVVAKAGLLLSNAPRRRQSSRPHNGVVAVERSELRWCSDGFEIKCDSGETVTTTFAKDCCDREVMAWRAWEGKGLPGEPVREMLIEAVEQRFGSIEAIPDNHVLEFLSDNGGAYIAADTRSVARQLGLTPINTPVCSPQSNGMAESFVNTFKRDYVSRMDLRDAPIVMAQLSAAFEHFNEVHPHSSLRMRSPREFRRLQAAQPRKVRQDESALNCD